ncbi:hypothetical protein GRI41_12685 [Altererythrobacter aquaemixtae]|uniref:DUF4440 domain-containing protein n=1 Tax=Pontixanthobacter aquaemixtae TaxID=1958940 RepID=A0A844ZXL6_9SPHN|nr:hypothetical protein [Pontixanthobacter aquaemixtae]
MKRALVGAPGEAQPTRVVATELAFARAAREDGQWTAFRAFAAPGAVIHARSGVVDAGAYLSGLADPAEAVQWAPRAVWMSCDSLIAVSQGRFRDPEGKVGTYTTAWKRQSDGDYRWTYDVAVLDDPQPPPRPELGPASEDEIVVSALSSIKGLVSDCPREAEPVPQPPEFAVAPGVSHAMATSPDRTLRWRWEHKAGGDRRFILEYLTSGKWVTAIDQSLGMASPEKAGE